MPATRLETLERVVDRLIEAETVREKDRLTLPLEARLSREIGVIFGKQGRSFLRAFASLKSQFIEVPRPRDWEVLWERTAAGLAESMRRELDRGYRAALVAGGVTATRGVPFDVSFDLKNPRAERWLQYRAADRVTAINGETRNQMRTILRNAGAEGWSYDRTAKVIKERFDGFSGPPLRGFLPPGPVAAITSRAQMVAVTEIGDAYEAGNRFVADDLTDAGIPMEKKWLTPGDSRVCPKCSGNAGEGWLPLETPFQSGDNEPLAHPGCRCTAEYQVAEDALPADTPKTPEGKPKLEAPDKAAERERLRQRKSLSSDQAEERAHALLDDKLSHTRTNPFESPKISMTKEMRAERIKQWKKAHPGADKPTFDFYGWDPDIADEATDLLVKLADDYPLIAKEIGQIGTTAMDPGTFAISVRHGKYSGDVFGQPGYIKFNNKFVSSRFDDHHGWYKEAVRDGHFVRTNAEALEYVFTHEFGHQVSYSVITKDHLMKELDDILARELTPTEILQMSRHTDADAVLSGYSTKNRAEFFAEVFAELRLSPNPRKIARVVGKWWNKLLAGAK